MKHIKYFALVAFLSLILSSCNEGLTLGTVGGNFTSESEIGIYDQETSIFLFDEAVHQSVTHSSGLIYRVQTDDQSQYFHVALSGSASTEGSVVEVVLSCEGVSGVSSGDYTMEVLKISGSYSWLWDDSASLGLLIPVEL
ncbi:MAG: hypothetical protein R3Y19_01070 [Rikenellaceae bacterium]